MATPAGQVSCPAAKSRVTLVLGEPAAGVADPPGLAEDGQVRSAVADQGRGQVGPVDVQLGQAHPGGLQVGLDVVGDAGLGHVGRGDPDRGYQTGVQVPQHMPLVAVEQHRAGLAAVPHLGVFDADPPVFGDPAAQRRRWPGQVYVLVTDLAGGCHRRWPPPRRSLPCPATKASTVSSRPSTPASAPSRAPRGATAVPVKGRLQAGGGQVPARQPAPRRWRFLRPAPAPAAPRSRPGPYAGRVPSS